MTVGDLTPNAIGRDRVIIQHEGSTVSGVLTDLVIDSDLIRSALVSGPVKLFVGEVSVTVTLGHITIGPLPRNHPCEVVA